MMNIASAPMSPTDASVRRGTRSVRPGSRTKPRSFGSRITQAIAVAAKIGRAARSAPRSGPREARRSRSSSRIASLTVTRQSLACIRCGACLNACPVYQQVGGHAYGSVYPGPIGAVITPQLMGIEKAAQLPYASSLCGACREVCPVKIDIPRLLLHLRSEIVTKQRNGSAAERLAFKVWAWVMMSPALYEMGSVAARLSQKVFPLSKAWTSGRDLRAVERESGRFRTFLRMALKRFLANEWDRVRAQKRGGGKRLPNLG